MSDEKPMNYFNTWEYVAQVKSDNEPTLQSLVQFWKAYEKVQVNLVGADVSSMIHTDITPDPAEAFCEFVQKGQYPPPELMMSVCSALSLYSKSGGDLSLEECFYGPAYRGKNKAKRTVEGALYELFCISRYMQSLNSSHKKLSEVEFAAEFLNEVGQDVDVDTFLKGCRRWKRKTGRFSGKSAFHEFSDT